LLNCFVESPHSGLDEDHENWSDVSTVELGIFSEVFYILIDLLISAR